MTMHEAIGLNALGANALDVQVLDAAGVRSVIEAAYPKPEDVFLRAKWAGELSLSLSALSKSYGRESAAHISRIQSEGLVSDEYEVRSVMRPYSWVDKELLRQMDAEVFASVVHVKQAFAEDVIGRAELYRQVAAQLGDGVREHEVVGVVELKDVMGAAKAERYIRDGEKFVRFEVVERG